MKFWCETCSEDHEVEVPPELENQMKSLGDDLIECRRITAEALKELQTRGFTPKDLPSETIMELARWLTELYHMRFLANVHCDKLFEGLLSRMIESAEAYMQEKKLDPLRSISLFMYGMRVKGYHMDAEEEMKSMAAGNTSSILV